MLGKLFNRLRNMSVHWGVGKKKYQIWVTKKELVNGEYKSRGSRRLYQADEEKLADWLMQDMVVEAGAWERNRLFWIGWVEKRMSELIEEGAEEGE